VWYACGVLQAEEETGGLRAADAGSASAEHAVQPTGGQISAQGPALPGAAPHPSLEQQPLAAAPGGRRLHWGGGKGQGRERQQPWAQRMTDPALFHYALFSDNVLAVAVVVNSTAQHMRDVSAVLEQGVLYCTVLCIAIVSQQLCHKRWSCSRT